MSSTVAKALALLDHFSEETPEIGLSDLARRSGLDKATVHRMLGVMVDAGLVEQRSDSRLYRLGAGILRLARVRENAFPVTDILQPVLEALVDETGETAHASLISGRALATVGLRESPKSSRVSLVAGEVLPFHGTASGLATLAFAGDDLLRKTLARPLEAKTGTTITDPDVLRQHVDQARQAGYAVSDQTYEDDVFGIAAPIFDPSGQACGAIAVATPSHRITDDHKRQTIAAVLRAAAAVTSGLGGLQPKAHVDAMARTLAELGR